MADQISRRGILQGMGLATIGTLAACDGVDLPGLNSQTPPSAPTAPETTLVEAGITPEVLPSSQTEFIYEIRYSEDEWRARLSPDAYKVLREGATEPRHSHYLTRETAPGVYHCQGCDLPVYTSSQKTILDIGWVFFKHALPDSVLLGVDQGRIEAHCRRCGSHLGHVLYVQTEILHCINGTALDFKAA